MLCGLEVSDFGGVWLSDFGVPVDSRRIYSGRILGLRVDSVRLSGERVFRREVVEHPGAVAVLPFLDDGKVLLIRQFRYAVGEVLLEIPAGTLEKGEDPPECARRELIEETGYEAGVLELLFSCFLAPGYSTERIHIFVASKLRKVGSRPEIDEEIELEPADLQTAEVMIGDGRIVDAKTISAISYYLLSRSLKR